MKSLKSLIDLKPSQLSKLKNQALDRSHYERAMNIQGYIDHCILLSRMVKDVLKN